MFSTLYNNIFPALGAVFGLFATLADMPYHEFLRFLFVIPASWEGSLVVNVVNVFTGASLYVPSVGSVLHDILMKLAGALGILGFDIVLIPFAEAVLSAANDVITGVLSACWSLMLTPMGFTTTSPTWVCMLALSPAFAIGVGLLKFLWDLIPWF